MSNVVLAIGATICLGVALIEAWLIVAHFADKQGPVARIIPGGQDLLRSHIDYLMMSQFLFVFFGIFIALNQTPSLWIVCVLCFGSFFNPFAFLVRAIRPAYKERPPVLFKIFLLVSCSATTIGYATTAWLISEAAIDRVAR